MAKKGQTFKRYSKEIKTEILKKYFEEYISSRVLSEEYKIPQTLFKHGYIKSKKEKIF